MVLMRVNIAGLLLLTMLSACVTGIDPAILDSAEYNEGFSHGCATAGKQSNGFKSEIVENPARSESNERYIIGWRQGFYACGGKSMDPKAYNTGEWYHDIGD